MDWIARGEVEWEGERSVPEWDEIYFRERGSRTLRQCRCLLIRLCI